MKLTSRWATVSALVVAVGALGGVATAASTPKSDAKASLHPLAHQAPERAARGLAASGRAEFSLSAGNRLATQVEARKLSPNLPHAIHIHGFEAAAEIARCPGGDAADNVIDDGLIDTVEGLDDYGPVLVSFTTSGGTSGDLLVDGLALDRMPVADASGRLSYARSFPIPATVANDLADKHVVIHGADLNQNGSYDGPEGALGAALGPNVTVPLEAEIPVACGSINGPINSGR